MRLLIPFASILFFFGCAPPEFSNDQNRKRHLIDLQFNSVADLDLARTWAALEPTVRSMCGAETSLEHLDICRFSVSVETRIDAPANAKSSLGEDGVTHISVTQTLLHKLRNDDEMAFVLAHEAAHTIADHHSLGRADHPSGGFVLLPRGGHRLEFEADVIGSIILMRAGYDPVSGAAVLKRLLANPDHRSHSHPSANERLQIVQKTIAALNAGWDININ